jgi:hypothetical protein
MHLMMMQIALMSDRPCPWNIEVRGFVEVGDALRWGSRGDGSQSINDL